MASIWHTIPDLKYINQYILSGTLDSHLGISMTDVGDNFLSATMPADARTFQPSGIVHGGANVVLAETLGSTAAYHVIDRSFQHCRGQDISATHLRPVSGGVVTGTTRPIHLGRRSHVWEIELRNSAGKLTCVARLILAIIDINRDKIHD